MLDSNQMVVNKLALDSLFSPLAGTFDSLLCTEMGFRMNHYRLCEERNGWSEASETREELVFRVSLSNTSNVIIIHIYCMSLQWILVSPLWDLHY